MFASIVGAISNFMYSYLLIVMLVAVGLYYTLRTRLVQLRMFKETIRVILEKPVGADAVSSFQALMVSTASRVGTGNIIGISTAVALGGPGAVFWCWITGVFGIATCYADATLAKKELSWEAKYDIEEMCADSWRWQSNNPNGYND